MELFGIIITVVGSIASLYGAHLSKNSEKNAKSAAEKAENVKDQIIQKQNTTAIANLLYEAKRTQKVFGKYSIAQTNRSLTGVDFNKDSENLQNFVFQFNENRSLLNENTEIETEPTYTQLNDLLVSFSGVRSNADKKENGNQIRLLIDDIIFKMRKCIDKNNSSFE
jgi:hypothetical protein